MLVTIKNYSDVINAQADKSYLESKGIKCHLENESTVAANWLLSQAVGGIQLQVHKENAEKAKELIKTADNTG